MAERFEKLYEIRKRLFKSESPIIVEAGALLKDTVSEEFLIQLNFRSVSEKKIKAFKVFINVFDVFGNIKQKEVEYQYLDLSVSKGDCFGSKKAIILSDKSIRSFKIAGYTVVFEDDDIWELREADDMEEIPESELSSYEFDITEHESSVKLVQDSETKQKQIRKYVIAGTFIVAAIIVISIIFSAVNTNNVISQIEDYIESEQYEHAYDFISSDKIKNKIKNQYKEEIIAGMREQFNEEKTGAEVLNVDGIMICEANNEIFYFDENAKIVTLYKSYEAEMDYRNVRGVIVCYEGDRIWIKKDFMYANGWIYFYEVRDIFKAGKHENSITHIKRVNIENGNSETIEYNDIKLSGLYKLSDGRILLDDYSDMVYDPYSEKLIKNDNVTETDKESCIYTTDD